MSLPPHLSFLRLGSVSAPHTLELWLDFVCPFSGALSSSGRFLAHLEDLTGVYPGVNSQNVEECPGTYHQARCRDWKH